MYKNNRYTRIYHRIVERAKARADTKKSANLLLGYVECHHILPVSMGGSNLKDNLVYLTAEEHFICHLLLIRMVIDPSHLSSMRFAFWKFQQTNSKQCRKRLTSWEYSYMKKQAAIASSEMNTGRIMPERSEEYREKISQAHKGKPSALRGRKLPKETKDKISEKHKGRISPTKGKKLKPRSPEHTAKQAASRKGKPGRTGIPQSEETKKKISSATKGRVPWNKKIRPLVDTTLDSGSHPSFLLPFSSPKDA